MATDPVCGMSVDPSTAASENRLEQRYYFCSAHCQAKFKANPTAYVGKGSAEEPVHGHDHAKHGGHHHDHAAHRHVPPESGAQAAPPGAFPPAFRDASGQVGLYFEAAADIPVLVLLGEVLQLRARESTSSAIRALLKLAPLTAILVGAEGNDELLW